MQTPTSAGRQEGFERLRARLWRQASSELVVAPTHRSLADSTDASDRTLAICLRAGDAAAFDQLFRRYGGRHLAFARRWLQEADAETAVQDAWVDLLGQRAHVPEIDELGRFLHGFLRFAVLRQRRARFVAEPLPEELPDEPDGDLPIFESGNLRRLEQALVDFDPLMQEVVLLSLDAQTPAEIAATLELEAGHVRVLKHRAMTRLQQVLR